MRALMAEKERFTVHVRPEQVCAALRADGGGPVERQARSRRRWSGWPSPPGATCWRFPDSSRVTALEDFYRRRMLYQMSRPGEAAERALAQYDAALGTRGALQSVALEDIVVLLTSLRDTVAAERQAGEPVDPARDPPGAAQPARAVRRAGRERRGVHGLDAAHHRPARRRRRGVPRLQGAADRVPGAVHPGPAHAGGRDRRPARPTSRRRRGRSWPRPPPSARPPTPPRARPTTRGGARRARSGCGSGRV